MKNRTRLILMLGALGCFALPGCTPLPQPQPVPDIKIPTPPPPLPTPPAPAPAPTPEPSPYDPSGSPDPFGSADVSSVVVLAKKIAVPEPSLSAFDERLERVETNQAATDHRLDDIEARVDKLENPPVPVKAAEPPPQKQSPVPDPESTQPPTISQTAPVANGVTYRSAPMQCYNGQCYQVPQYSSPSLPVQRYGTSATGRWFRFR